MASVADTSNRAPAPRRDGPGALGVARLKVPRSLEFRDVAMRLVEGACKLVRARERDAGAGNRFGVEFDAKVLSGFGEAFANVVIHGGPGPGEIEIEVEPHDDHLTIRITDGGRPFDLSTVPSPRLEQLPESGLGIHIIRSWMDDVSYQPGEKNVLTLTKRMGGFTRSDTGEDTLLTIDGVLDAVTSPDIRPTVDALVAEQRRSIQLDLSGLRLIDSSGVGVIVSLYKRVKAYGGRLRVVGAKDQPAAIFKLLKLDRVLGT